MGAGGRIESALTGERGEREERCLILRIHLLPKSKGKKG